MSDIESICHCPNCNKVALVKYGDWECGWRFIACPHCLFLYDEDDESCSFDGRVHTWDIILKAHGCSLRELRKQLLAISDVQLERFALNWDKMSKSKRQSLTRLGGLAMFYQHYTNPIAVYRCQYPSVKWAARREIERLNQSLKIGSINEKMVLNGLTTLVPVEREVIPF